MNLQIYDFDGKRQYFHTLRLTSELVDLRVGYASLRPTGYTPCELQELAFLGAARLCKSKICARSLECEHSDSASLDYVASGLAQSVLDSHPWALRQQKEVNRKG